MTQTQFLIFFIALIPLVNPLINRLCSVSDRLFDISLKAVPILYLINLVGLYGSLKNDNSYLSLIEATRGISVGFVVDEISFLFLSLLCFLWIVFVFFSQRFFKLMESKNSQSFQIFFALVIAFVNLIILSKNLLSILFFYNCLVILCHFFAARFLYKNGANFSNFFTFLIFLESVFLFLAIIATYKFTGEIEFYRGSKLTGVISENPENIKYTLLLVLYLGGLFLSILFPSYIFYRSINLEPFTIYTVFFLSYALSSIYIFIKLINFIFGFAGFAVIVSEIGFEIFELIFFLNIALVSFFLAKSKGIKSSFFYIFFQQFLLAIMAITIFSVFDNNKIYLTLFSFLLSITLIFLAISNFILYLSKAEDKSFDGLFYKLKISSGLFILGVLNMTGFIPAIGGAEKFFFLKAIIQEGLWLSLLTWVIALISIAIFAFKIMKPILTKDEEKVEYEEDIELAKDIDFDSSLILTSSIVALATFISLIAYPFLIKFL